MNSEKGVIAMSVLCFGSFGTTLLEASSFNKKEVIDALINAIVSKAETNSINESDKYKLLRCEIDIEFIRTNAGTNAVCSTINTYFTQKIMPKLKPALYDDLKSKLKNLIVGDNSIETLTKQKFIISINNDELSVFLATVFNYSATRPNVHADPFANSHLSSTQVADFSNTINSTTFNNVFIAVPHNETLNLINNSHIKTFHLNIEDNTFTLNGLHDFLQKNIGRYIFSRTQLENFHINDEAEIIGAKAIALLKNANFNDTQLGNELGDIILYIFLEQVLNAPKIYTKLELATSMDNKTVSNQGSIHLLTLSGAESQYQMVFGKSSIINSITEAIDNAFVAIEKVKKSTAKEYQILETSVLSQSFNTATSEYLKTIIIPQKRSATTSINNAFGVFLGYTIDIDAKQYSNTEFLKAVKEKMIADIKAQIPYILSKIKDAKMENNSFYFYLLPFNNADNEKTEIMKVLLNGGVV